MRSGYVRSDHGTTHYWANAPTAEHPGVGLVFCHGLTADHTLFDMQIPYWAPRRRVLTWDWPLHGQSRPYHPFTYDHVVEELQTILDQENFDRIVLIGQSAGGYIAQAYSHKYPERVAGFVGVGTTPFGIARYYTPSDLFWIRHYTKIAWMLPYSYYCSAGAKSVAVTEPARKNMYDALVRLGRQGMLRAAKAVYDEFLAREEPVTFDCPVLLTHGEQDQTGLVPAYNQAWSQDRGYPLMLIPDAAHNANYDNPEVFNQILERFLDSGPM